MFGRLVQVILAMPSHPGNIGGVARAMKNMGLEALTLVSPLQYPHPHAIERASGATDVLEKVQVVPTVEEGVAECQWLLGVSARTRALEWPRLTPGEAAKKVAGWVAHGERVGLLFGSEQSGLSNEHLQLSDYHVVIPANPLYPSLNLVCAVQILAYEIYQAIERASPEKPRISKERQRATQEETEALWKHFYPLALHIGYINPDYPEKILPYIRRLFLKARLEKKEVSLLRGLLKMICQRILGKL